MTPINTLTSTAVPLPLPNIDTDQIIPKQFLKRIERTGYGDFLFYDWRRLQDGPNAGAPDPSFILNNSAYNGSQILIAEKNFGCGSSREHAAWALAQYGFLAVILSQIMTVCFLLVFVVLNRRKSLGDLPSKCYHEFIDRVEHVYGSGEG